MHLAASIVGGGGTNSSANMTIRLLGNPLFPNYDADLGWFDGSARRHYWQAVLLLSVGLSLLLGAFVFLFVGLTLRRCPTAAAGAAAATLSSLALVALLVSTRAVDAPKALDLPKVYV